MQLRTFILVYSLMFFLFSCVGTIKDNTPKTNRSVAANTTAQFAGAIEGGIISHEKGWVKFRAATGGSGSFIYIAYLNGLPTPIASVSGASALADDQGFLYITIENLSKLTNYMVRVRVYDLDQDLEDSNNEWVSMWTASDYLPVFSGVSLVENVGGVDAMTQLNVRWNPATTDAGAPFDAKYSVSGYSVYYSTSLTELWEVLRLTNQHAINLAPYPNTQIKSIIDPGANSSIIDSLAIDTVYYVAVRSRDSDGTPQYERNIIIQEAQTYAHQPIEFAGLTSASVPKDGSGFSQVDLSWTQCVACGIYRVYAKPTVVDSGSIHPANDVAYFVGSVTNLALTSSSFAGLTKNTSYKVYMLSCIDATCGWDGSTLDERQVVGRTSSLGITTTPQLAPFAVEPPDPTPPAGEEGLSNLDITWQMDMAQGYYTKVRIFHVLDKNGDTTNYNGANFVELFRTVGVGPYIDPAVNTTPLDFANNPTSARITNLTLDQEYCFQVLPFIEFPDLNNPGEEIALPVGDRPPVVCGTPIYEAPIFGVNSLEPACSGINATDLTLSWTHPDIKNVMTHYEVYSMFFALGAFAFDTAAGAWENHGAGDNYVLKNFLLETQNSVSVTGLVPNTVYWFGVNTYYDPPGPTAPIRKVPANATTPGLEAIISCQTAMPQVDHRGWREIMAIGPKINGLTYNQNIAIGIPAATARTNSIIQEFLLPDLKIPYEWNQRTNFLAAPENDMSIGSDGGQVPGASTTGIVRLKWSDFQVNGTTERLSDYYGPGVLGLGYRILRIAHDTVPPTDQPAAGGDTNYLDDIRNEANVNWSLATSLRFYIRQHNVFNTLGDAALHSVAYSSDAINLDVGGSVDMISSEYARTQGPDSVFEFVDYPPAAGKTYYYKIVGVFGGVASDFFSSREIQVVKVIVPPDNMSLVHRWIANQEICGRMERGGEGNDCPMSSQTDQACCDPTLPAGTCSDPDRHYRCKYNGLNSKVDLDDDGLPDVPQTYSVVPGALTRYFDYGKDVLIDRFEMGCNITSLNCDGDDCIGSDPWTGPIPVTDDSILSVYHKKGVAVTDYDTGCTVRLPGAASVWQWLYNMPVAADNLQNAVTNNAYMPPVTRVLIARLYELCEETNLDIDGVNYSKRMMRIQDKALGKTYHNHYAATKITDIESKLSYSSQSCNNGNKILGSDGAIDYSKNNYVSSAHAFATTWKTGSSGADPANRSTAVCVSRFGVQDMVGNVAESMSERLFCQDLVPDAENLKESCTSDPALFGAVQPLDLDAQNIELRNGDGSYLDFSSYLSAMSRGKLHPDASGNSFNSNNSPFVSPALMLALSCSGTACRNSNGLYNPNDDNTLLSFWNINPGGAPLLYFPSHFTAMSQSYNLEYRSIVEYSTGYGAVNYGRYGFYHHATETQNGFTITGVRTLGGRCVMDVPH